MSETLQWFTGRRPFLYPDGSSSSLDTIPSKGTLRSPGTTSKDPRSGHCGDRGDVDDVVGGPLGLPERLTGTVKEDSETC